MNIYIEVNGVKYADAEIDDQILEPANNDPIKRAELICRELIPYFHHLELMGDINPDSNDSNA